MVSTINSFEFSKASILCSYITEKQRNFKLPCIQPHPESVVPKVSQYIFQSRHQVVYGLCRGKIQYVCHEIQTYYIKPCLATSVNSNSSLAALHSTRGIFEEKRTRSKMSRVVTTTTTVKTEHSNCDWGCHNSNDIQYIVTPMTYHDIFSFTSQHKTHTRYSSLFH